MSTCGGERRKIFLLPHCSSTPRTIPKLAWGKRGAPCGPETSVHLTETCEETLPHVIPHVATTPAPKTDEAMTEVIQAEVHQAAVPPGEHVLDAGYMSSRVLVNSHKRFGIDVLGPAPVDSQWQAQIEHGIDASQFVLDWEHKQATWTAGAYQPQVGFAKR